MEDLTAEALSAGFQVSDKNPMLGIESRAALLSKLGTSLLSHPDIFGKEGRPGNLVGKMHHPRLPHPKKMLTHAQTI